MNKKIQILTLLMCFLSFSFLIYQSQLSNTKVEDIEQKGLLAIVKNDHKSFEEFLRLGGKIETYVDISPRRKTLAQLLVDYERVDMINFAVNKRTKFEPTEKEMELIWETTIAKNNQELYQAIRRLNPKEKIKNRRVGKNHQTLLQYASSQCSFNLIKRLESEGLMWEEKDQTGATSLTLATQNKCHPILSLWKNRGALDLLKTSKDLSLTEITRSIENTNAPTKQVHQVAAKIPDFYKKRSIPKESYNRLELVEPGDRPGESIQTAEYSEFSD